ncbi:hypothetical protein GF336_05110 [Candidatus Woesearchaeota archaeon]|nr:hypothetical protein [Candidatus Woesearchaeota archaeon]
MKKISLLLGLILVLSMAVVSAQNENYFFVVDDQAPSEDVMLVQDIISNLQLNLPPGNVKLNSQVTTEDLPDKVTTFVYMQNALIIVGDTAPSEYVVFAQKVSNYLQGRGISAEQKISSEINDDDLKEEMAQQAVCGKTNLLSKGQTKTYRFPDGTDYEISLKEISNNKVKFEINGEVTSSLALGNSYMLADGEEFIAASVSTNSASFCINGAAGQVIEEESNCGKTNSLTTGETKALKFPNGAIYEIKIESISNNKAKLNINGEITSSKGTGESYMLADGEELIIASVSGNAVSFCINGAAGEIIVEPSTKKHYFVVDDTAPASDVQQLTKLINELKEQGIISDGEYESKLNGEASRNDLEDRVTVFIYNGDAIIIVGSTSPSEDVILSIKISNVLKDEFDINPGATLLSSEITSDDLTEAMEVKAKCGKTNSLLEGETKTIEYVDGTVYEMELTSITNNKAKFTINGEVTSALSAGDSYMLSDGEEFILDTLSSSLGKFCINGGSGEVISAPTVTGPTITPTIEPTIEVEPDECNTNADCDDNNACTSDLCSGTPKKCSHIDASLGCSSNGNCIPVGVRTDGMYCDIDRTMKSQVEETGSCNNNYECVSNVCVNSECISPSFLQKILNWFKNLFG